jgi:hypothetical protein
VLLERSTRKKMTAAVWGEQLPLCCYFLCHFWKSSIHPSRPL